MACEDCATKFGVLKRRRTCNDCSYDFCSSCIIKVKGTDKHQRCRRCKVLFSFPLDKSAVNNLRIRDLKWYLGRLAVSVHGCREKSELVDLVMLHSGSYFVESHPVYNRSQNTPMSSSESDRYNSTYASPLRSRSAPHSPGPSRNYRDFRNNGSQENVSRSCPQSPPLQHEGIASASGLNSLCTSKEQINDDFKPVSIEDVINPEQISDLSVRQLKLILTRSFIDYKGCCEKHELQDRVLRLWNQKKSQKIDIDAVPDENMCKICMEHPIDSVLLECGHMTTCTECGKRLHECPICRQYVVRVVHTFKA